MDALPASFQRSWPVAALLISAAMLATAHAFQTFGGYQPCTLCLRQREVYWAALAVAAAVIAADAWRPARGAGPWIGAALALLFFYGAGVAAYHAGAEWKWWPGPATCASGGAASASAADLDRLLAGARIRPPACDQAQWRMLGLSMAGWNVLVSLGLAALSSAWAAGAWAKGRH